MAGGWRRTCVALDAGRHERREARQVSVHLCSRRSRRVLMQLQGCWAVRAVHELRSQSRALLLFRPPHLEVSQRGQQAQVIERAARRRQAQLPRGHAVHAPPPAAPLAPGVVGPQRQHGAHGAQQQHGAPPARAHPAAGPARWQAARARALLDANCKRPLMADAMFLTCPRQCSQTSSRPGPPGAHRGPGPWRPSPPPGPPAARLGLTWCYAGGLQQRGQADGLKRRSRAHGDEETEETRGGACGGVGPRWSGGGGGGGGRAVACKPGPGLVGLR